MTRPAASLVLALALSACRPEAPSWTLYRASPSNLAARVAVATFDAPEPGPYNRENCLIAAGLFAAQPGVKVRWWCEAGRIR